MDDTGNSDFHHLHFSIHDRNLPHPNVDYGQSVRPIMEGALLEDGDSVKCIKSSNVGSVPGLNFIPGAVTFGAVLVGECVTNKLKIHNTLGSDVTLNIPASTSGPFSWGAFSGTIPHGSEQTIGISFKPKTCNPVTATLIANSDAPGRPAPGPSMTRSFSTVNSPLVSVIV
jgi:hypothetical protein